MDCLKLSILDEQYKSTEQNVSSSRKELTFNFCVEAERKHTLFGEIISNYNPTYWQNGIVPEYVFTAAEKFCFFYFFGRHKLRSAKLAPNRGNNNKNNIRNPTTTTTATTIIMKTIIFFSLLFFNTLGLCSAIGQNKNLFNNDSCDVQILIKIKQNIENITEKDIINFLYNFNGQCKNNVEYNEFSNEVLFFLLSHKNAKLVIKVLYENQKLPFREIRQAIENPISDDINLYTVYNNVIKIKGISKTKKMIIASIKIAMHKTPSFD